MNRGLIIYTLVGAVVFSVVIIAPLIYSMTQPPPNLPACIKGGAEFPCKGER